MTTSIRSVLALALVCCFAAGASAGSIVSSPFSIGYGFSAAGGGIGGWSTNETVGSNTPTVQGDFSFTPIVTGGQFDGAGPGFPSRVLTSAAGFTGVSIAYPSQAGFGAAITGAYLGALPDGSNYRLKLNIDQVSIYGVAYTSFLSGEENLSIIETTAGNTGSSAVAILTPTAAYATASSYTQVVWDPADFEEVGLTSSRTFALASDDLRGIDGFEIFGTVELVFDDPVPAPEPSSLLLIGVSSLGLCQVTRRRRANRTRE